MPKPGATVRRTEDNEPVGPKMHAAISLVARRGPAQSQKWIAERVGPNGSLNFGYRPVKRCLRYGLLAIDREHDAANPHGSGAVVLTDKGERYLDAHTEED